MNEYSLAKVQLIMYVREKTAVLSQQGRVWQSADRLRKQIIISL